MTPTLTITRGAPGSGKTYWAKGQVATNEKTLRVNRDDLRQLHFGLDAPIPYHLEEAITATEQSMVRASLRKGWNVIVDDCHTKARYVTAWREIAEECGAGFVVKVMDTPLEECVRRDERRERTVGREVIREMNYSLLQSLRAVPEALPAPYTYTPDISLPPTWLIDIDGTLALMHSRGPFDWHRVGEDEPNKAVVRMAQIYNTIGEAPVIMSGRDESCRDLTIDWLSAHRIPYRALHMRPQGDQRKDSIVKLELFRAHVASGYNVQGVLDDRDQVVNMWRRIGLACFQVAPGDF